MAFSRICTVFLVLFLVVSSVQIASAGTLTTCPIFPCDKTVKYVYGFFVGETSDGSNSPDLGPTCLSRTTTSPNLSGTSAGQQSLAALPTTVVKDCVDFCNSYNRDSIANGGKLALYWTFELKQVTDNSGAMKLEGKCYCYSPDVCDKVGVVFDDRSTPIARSSSWSLFVTGNLCISGLSGDPHFTGADKSSFEFSGIPNNNYALLSDHDLQVNAFFGGRFDDGKALNWIRKVGILWKTHTLVLEAREGPEWKYGNGYMQRILVDNLPVVLTSAGESAAFSFADGVDIEVTWQLAEEPSGDDVVDKYEVRLGKLLNVALTLRPEVASLRTQEDGVVHFSVNFVGAMLSKDVHGIIGQTYRPDFVGRLEKQNLVWSELLQKNVVPTENAEGFIDGRPEDYKVPHLLSTDCTVSRFSRAANNRKLLL